VFEKIETACATWYGGRSRAASALHASASAVGWYRTGLPSALPSAAATSAPPTAATPDNSYACPPCRPRRPLTLDNPPTVAAPFGDRFAHVARLDLDGGALLVLAGQVAVDDAGEVVAPDDATAQAERIFEIIHGILAAHGATFAETYLPTARYAASCSPPTRRPTRRQAQPSRSADSSWLGRYWR
jgi:enamine deaminase RidA (YjgF/YER057c/UK114 family)